MDWTAINPKTLDYGLDWTATNPQTLDYGLDWTNAIAGTDQTGLPSPDETVDLGLD